MNLFDDFISPSKKYYPRPLWFWNDRPTEKNLSEIIDSAIATGYGGFGILPYDACKLTYLGDDYLRAYGYALGRAKEKGIKLCLYDEWWFPSGSAGGLLKKNHPEACARRLDKTEYPADGGYIDIALPDGTLMSAVAMHKESKKIINLREMITPDRRLKWQMSEKGYTVMLFTCVLSDWDRVNYLDPGVVMKFINITHDVYYKNFSQYFGNVIDSCFYDEPQMYALDGRMWTDNFNDTFREKYGTEPDMLYPALWYDIGERTSFARNRLLSHRAELYSSGFPKVINEWCNSHGISLTGHVDQEEAINPCGITGDLMKSFKYQDIPGFDEISFPGRGRKIYKLVSSASYNWDRPLVMSECFGAMQENITLDTMYDEVMEQFAKHGNETKMNDYFHKTSLQ